MSNRRILIIDDDLDLCFLLQRLFEGSGYTCETSIDARQGLSKFQESPFPLVLVDFRLPDMEGLDLLKKLKELKAETEVMIITGYSDVNLAVKAMKLGAFDYITKPLIPEDILEKAERVFTQKKKPKKTSKTPPKPSAELDDQAPYIGTSRAFKKVIKYVDLVAPTNITVIMEGETGVGKEITARMIHDKSPRKDNPFVAVDCGAIPENLVISELFGHVKGAFTGATSNKKGHFLQANTGTLFLDEIGNLSYDVQVQLLRVLQDMMVKRLGEQTLKKLDIRLLVATNAPLNEMVAKGEFRSDLYHRLNEFKIDIPALREREEDIIGLTNYFIEKFNQKLALEVEGADPEALEIIRTYAWPGNIREMRNAIQRAVLLCQKGQIHKRHLPDELILQMHGNFRESSHFPSGSNGNSAAPQTEKKVNLKSVGLQAQASIILEALKKNSFNRSRTARYLNIDRKTLYNKMKRFGIET